MQRLTWKGKAGTHIRVPDHAYGVLRLAVSKCALVYCKQGASPMYTFPTQDDRVRARAQHLKSLLLLCCTLELTLFAFLLAPQLAFFLLHQSHLQRSTAAPESIRYG